MSGANVIPLVIGCGFRASIPLGAAWAAVYLASRASAATRHFIWACAIALALLLPLAAIVTPRWSVATPPPLARLASAARLEASPSTIPSVAIAKRIGMNAVARPENSKPSGLKPWMVATWIWTTGAIGIACYTLMGHFAAWRLYRTTRRVEHSLVQHAERLARGAGLSRNLCVVESAAVSAPVVLHFWRPIVVMPQAAGRWSRARIRAVLLHEFAHIKRNDFQTQSLAQFACAIYWFNPLVWFAAHQLRLERERACDDYVLLSGTSGADYATDLLEIACDSAAPTMAHFAIGLAGRRSQLEQRIVAIVNPRTPRHMTTVLGRSMLAIPILLVALASGAVQIKTRAIQVPLGRITMPAPVVQVRSSAPELSTGGTEPRMHKLATEPSAASNSPEEFHWSARMHEHQTIEVHLGRGSIKVLPSVDDTVRVEARTDNPLRSAIKAVSTADNVRLCNVVTTARESRNYCEPDSQTSRIQEDQPATEFVIYVPASLRFSGGTVLGDITTKHPRADSQMATINGTITLELGSDEGANFNGNVIDGEVDSDFPLSDNTPTLPTGERPAIKAPRIVHATIGSGGPQLSAVVVNGNIRLVRRQSE